MEVSIFPKPEVRALKQRWVEARLHSDAHDLELRERIAGLVDTLAGSPAQPIYVAVDPSSEEELGRFQGGTIKDWSPFVEFMTVVTEDLEAR